MARPIDSEFRKRLKAVTAKRAKTVIDHILKHGRITTDDLKSIYGYIHPPRAIRDVREEGIPIKTMRIKGPDGRSIAAYVFGDQAGVESHKSGGRRAFPKRFKLALLATYGRRCGICSAEFEDRSLQIDHRIPYQVAGEVESPTPSEFMLVCGSCNRAKSWSCEHCGNWRVDKSIKTCTGCYWASPLKYIHIATRDIRRVDLVWNESEIQHFEELQQAAAAAQSELPDFIKSALRRSRHSR